MRFACPRAKRGSLLFVWWRPPPAMIVCRRFSLTPAASSTLFRSRELPGRLRRTSSWSAKPSRASSGGRGSQSRSGSASRTLKAPGRSRRPRTAWWSVRPSSRRSDFRWTAERRPRRPSSRRLSLSANWRKAYAPRRSERLSKIDPPEPKPRMNWISNVVPPKIRSLLRRDTPENLWVKCPESGELVFHKDLEANLMVVPGSGYHMPISPKARLASLLDDGAYEEFATPETPSDPLKFRDIKRYSDRLKENRTKTGAADAVTVAFGKLEGQDITVAIQDFAFQGGTLGLAAGEAIVAGITAAIERATPFLIFTTSGGARMQEGMFALAQMVRTTVAVRRLRAAKLPYIVILTNPTTGGVTASYAMLGDVHIAEPGAVIGFAGARVIEQTIRERLPEGFQRAEYLRDHGMVDMVVPRPLQRQTLARLCRLLTRSPAAEAA